MLRMFSQNGVVEVYDLYHRLHQEYNKGGPDRKDKGKDPTYLMPGRDLRRSIWLQPMADFYDSKSMIKGVSFSARRSLRSHRTVRTSHNVEAIGMVETSIANRGDDSSVTSERTMHYSFQEQDDRTPRFPKRQSCRRKLRKKCPFAARPIPNLLG